MIRVYLKDGKEYDLPEPDLFHWGRAEDYFKDGSSMGVLKKQIRGIAYVCYILMKKRKPTPKTFWRWFEEDYEDFCPIDEEGNPTSIRTDKDGKVIPLKHMII